MLEIPHLVPQHYRVLPGRTNRGGACSGEKTRTRFQRTHLGNARICHYAFRTGHGAVTADKILGNVQKLPGLMEFPAASVRLGDSGNTYIDIGHFVPGGVIRDTCLGKIENALKGTDCLFGAGTVDTVCRDGRDGRVIAGDTV